MRHLSEAKVMPVWYRIFNFVHVNVESKTEINNSLPHNFSSNFKMVYKPELRLVFMKRNIDLIRASRQKY